MPCEEAAALYHRIDRAQADLRNLHKLDSPFAGLAPSDKDIIRKKAKQELRSANKALKEHHFVCDICDKED
jgi:hypothetical protein